MTNSNKNTEALLAVCDRLFTDPEEHEWVISEMTLRLQLRKTKNYFQELLVKIDAEIEKLERADSSDSSEQIEQLHEIRNWAYGRS